MRSFMASCVLTLAVVGCSSGSAEPATKDPISPTTTAVGSVSSDAGETGAASSTLPAGDEPTPVYEVVIEVSVDRLGLDERLDVAIDPTGLDDIDPFTRFSSCSGLRASISTFSVTAVDDTSTARSVSVVTVEHVTGPGIYDADVRVESVGADPVNAAGTMTLDQSLRAGSFQAFEPTGESVSGTFSCDGPPGTPVPIADGEVGDGVLRAVEVVALLRRGSEERIVSLTLDTEEAAAAAAEGPGVTGDAGDVLLRVEGGQALGAITAVELVAEPSPSLQMRVGGVSYEVEDVVIVDDDSGVAGTFSGVTADGVAIDGAFRCA